MAAREKISAEDQRNRRAHLRYRDPESTIITFFTKINDEEHSYRGLVQNESYSGMAVVFVGPKPIPKGETIYWKEADQIITPCKIIRCRKLDIDVYCLALSLTNIV